MLRNCSEIEMSNIAALRHRVGAEGGSVVAGLLQLAQLGSWDGMTFDLYPFRVDEAIMAAVSGGGNLLAMVALVRGWGSRK